MELQKNNVKYTIIMLYQEACMNIKEKDYILEYYREFYNEECGKWNTSLKSKGYD